MMPLAAAAGGYGPHRGETLDAATIDRVVALAKALPYPPEVFDMRMLSPHLLPAAYTYIRTREKEGRLFRINVVLERAFWRENWHGGFWH